MPRYQTQVTVPPQTGQADAVEGVLVLDERYIQDGLLFVPIGADGEVKARLLFGERSLLPTPDSDPTLIEGATDPAPIREFVPGTPARLTVRVWAPDADFPHTVTARVDAVAEGRANPLQRLTDLITGGGGARPARTQPPER
jgi:hypothetical protein